MHFIPQLSIKLIVIFEFNVHYVKISEKEEETGRTYFGEEGEQQKGMFLKLVCRGALLVTVLFVMLYSHH